MIRFKKSSRVLALAMVFVFMFSTLAMAAIPNNTIIFGAKAYSVSLLNDSSLANTILADFLANGNKFVYKTVTGSLMDANATTVAANTLPEVTYKAADKTTETYLAGDGDKKTATAVTLAAIAAQTVEAGKTVDVTVAATPADATITALSSDETKATAAVTGNKITVTGKAAGEANITVTAAKTGLTSGTATFKVTVTAPNTVVVNSVSAITTTKFKVTLSGVVDEAAAANFVIPGVTVVAATLNVSNKAEVALTVSGAVIGQTYAVKATGLKVAAVVQADSTKSFTMPAVDQLYSPTLTVPTGVTSLKADGASSTLVTFSLKDAEGVLKADAQDVEVAFTTTFGNFGEQRVSVQNGVATAKLDSEFLTSDRTANLKAQVVNAADTSLIGLKAEMNLLMTPNPGSADDTVTAASMTSAEASQADRVIAYFNKDVAPSNYVVAATGLIDATKAAITVRTGTTTNVGGTVCPVAGLMAVPGNTKALQILITVPATPLTDNENVYVQFIDKRGNVVITRDTTFKLTDARKPSMLSVVNEGLRTLKVTFSEPVNDAAATSGAANLANWTIDGIIFNGTATVGTYTAATGADLRSVVTLTKPVGTYFSGGAHSIQAANIGDWATLTDDTNVMNTQTLDFSIPVDSAAPIGTIEVQSPEQYVLTFNKDINETAAQLAAAIKLQQYNTTTAAWANYAVNSYAAAEVVNALLDVVVTNISAAGSNNKFLIQTDYDWTRIYGTNANNKNYFNNSYRIQLPVNSVTAATNGIKNAETNLPLVGAMETPDVTSPVISSMIQTAAPVPAGSSYDVTMSEPVKLSAAANPEGITLAENQVAIPTPTAEFIKKDNSITIQGAIAAAFIDKYNKVLRVTPVTPVGWTGTANTLSAGDWTLVVRSISDDVGNTAASATKDFTVAGSVTPASTFKVQWAFADTDTDLVVENIDAADGDASYDYVYVKFSKAAAITGDFKNALKTSNYTLNGQALPLGTQILANIAGYDDFDSVVDSITIRLPQGTLQAKNAPHVLNISAFIESTTADEKLSNAGELRLAYDNYVTALGAAAWTVSMAADIAADLVVAPSVTAAKAAYTACATGGIGAGEIAAFKLAYDASKVAIATLPATSLVKAQYTAVIDGYKAAVKALADYATYMSNTGANFALTAQVANVGPLQLVVDGAAAVTDFSDATKYTVTNSTPATATIANGTGVVTFVANGTTTITITDLFWGVSDTVTVTAAGGAITTITTN